jgi:hypothetical protein
MSFPFRPEQAGKSTRDAFGALGRQADTLLGSPVQRRRHDRRGERIDRHPADANAANRSVFVLSNQKQNVTLGILQRRVQKGAPHTFGSSVGNHKQASAAAERREAR